MIDAQVPELDADVGTGTEGDAEARCFSQSTHDMLEIQADVDRARLAERSVDSDVFPPDCHRSTSVRCDSITVCLSLHLKPESF